MGTTDRVPAPRFTRIRNDIAAERLGEGELVDAVNIDLDDAGAPSLRDGRSRLLTASAPHSLWSNAAGDTVLFVEGASLKRLDPGFASASTLATGLTERARMSYAEHNGLVYLSNGFESLVYEAGEARRWGIAPPAGLTASLTGGSLPAGRYLFTATYVDGRGRESGAMPAQYVDLPTGGGFIVTVPESSDDQVIAAIVYCSTANGETLYEAAAITGTTARIAGAAISLQRPLTTMFYGPAPVGSEVAVYRGRVYIGAGRFVWYSAPFGLELFRGDEFLGLEDPVTMIAPAEDGIFVGTERQTLWLAGASPEDMTVVQRHSVGVVRGTVTRAEAGRIKGLTGEFTVPVWLSTEGLCAGLPGGQLLNLTEQWRFSPPAAGASVFRARGDGFQLITTFHGA